MKKTKFINARRRLFTQQALLGSAAVATGSALSTTAAAESGVQPDAGEQPAAHKGYQETDKVLRYYELARF